MGFLRGIKSEVKDEEGAAEGLKREIQARQWEDDYNLWQHSHDPNYSEHDGQKRPCFGWHFSVQEPISPQCRDCNAQDTCASAFFEFIEYCNSIHFDPDLDYDEYDYEQDMLWGEEYKDRIDKRSREE